MRNLQSRIKQLEVAAGKQDDDRRFWPLGAWVHTVFQDIGETEEQARARYERETGRTIAEGEGVFMIRFVAAADGRPASPVEVAEMVSAPGFTPHRYTPDLIEHLKPFQSI